MPLRDWFASGLSEVTFLRRLLDHVSDCLVAVDTEGRIVLINEPYCRLLGEDQEKMIGRHITEAVSRDSKLHRVARGELVIIGAPLDVKGHQLFSRQVPIRQDGEIIGALGSALFADPSELKKAAGITARQELSIKNPQNAWAARYSVDDIAGQGTAIEALRERIVEAASHAHPVLVEGESGTGKELAAHAVHFHSGRARQPFVWINCASMPEALIESELFGYEGGAFTGAHARGKRGKFEIANGGTLFLDEIGDMPLHLQAALLRAVQSHEIVRVGGTLPISVDVRIVCATNRPLDELVRDGKFRLDLYHRLNVLSIRMPALRDRDDLPFLVEHLLDRLARQENTMTREMPRRVLNELLTHPWPGNVRQLENALLRFLISGDPEIEREEARPVEIHLTGTEDGLNLQYHLDRERAAQIRRALVQAGNDKDQAARLLGISRATLYRELRRTEH